VGAIFSDASYGAVTFTATGSERVVVNMNKALTSTSSDCPATSEAALALSASGRDANNYNHVEYWFPYELGSQGCSWGGLANYCVSTLGTAPVTSAGCWSCKCARRSDLPR
jgi:hypothetical protein